MQNNINQNEYTSNKEVSIKENATNENKTLKVISKDQIKMYITDDEEIKALLLLNKVYDPNDSKNEVTPKIEYAKDSICMYKFKYIDEVFKLIKKSKKVLYTELHVKKNSPLKIVFKDENKKEVITYYLAPIMEID